MKRSAVINAKHVKKIEVSWIRRKIFTVGIILLTFVLGALSSHIISEPKANAARASQYKVVWVPTPKVVGVTFGRHIEDLLNKEAEQGWRFHSDTGQLFIFERLSLAPLPRLVSDDGMNMAAIRQGVVIVG